MSTLCATEVELAVSVLTSPANRFPDDGLAGADVAVRAVRRGVLVLDPQVQARNTAEATGVSPRLAMTTNPSPGSM